MSRIFDDFCFPLSIAPTTVLDRVLKRQKATEEKMVNKASEELAQQRHRLFFRYMCEKLDEEEEIPLIVSECDQDMWEREYFTYEEAISWLPEFLAKANEMAPLTDPQRYYISKTVNRSLCECLAKGGMMDCEHRARTEISVSVPPSLTKISKPRAEKFKLRVDVDTVLTPREQEEFWKKISTKGVSSTKHHSKHLVCTFSNMQDQLTACDNVRKAKSYVHVRLCVGDYEKKVNVTGFHFERNEPDEEEDLPELQEVAKKKVAKSPEDPLLILHVELDTPLSVADQEKFWYSWVIPLQTVRVRGDGMGPPARRFYGRSVSKLIYCEFDDETDLLHFYRSLVISDRMILTEDGKRVHVESIGFDWTSGLQQHPLMKELLLENKIMMGVRGILRGSDHVMTSYYSSPPKASEKAKPEEVTKLQEVAKTTPLPEHLTKLPYSSDPMVNPPQHILRASVGTGLTKSEQRQFWNSVAWFPMEHLSSVSEHISKELICYFFNKEDAKKVFERILDLKSIPVSSDHEKTVEVEKLSMESPDFHMNRVARSQNN
jgi:hypothetical protein